MSIPVYKFALRENLKDDKRFLPTRAEPKATGWDVRAAIPNKETLTIKPFEHVKIPLGFRGFCPDGWWYQLKPRSSTFGKKNLHALYGTIDETYEGELVFACQYIPSFEFVHTRIDNDGRVAMFSDKSVKPLTINFADAIGQLVPTERQEMEVVEISNEEIEEIYKERDSVRKDGGFGSTGN